MEEKIPHQRTANRKPRRSRSKSPPRQASLTERLASVVALRDDATRFIEAVEGAISGVVSQTGRFPSLEELQRTLVATVLPDLTEVFARRRAVPQLPAGAMLAKKLERFPGGGLELAALGLELKPLFRAAESYGARRDSGRRARRDRLIAIARSLVRGEISAEAAIYRASAARGDQPPCTARDLRRKAKATRKDSTESGRVNRVFMLLAMNADVDLRPDTRATPRGRLRDAIERALRASASNGTGSKYSNALRLAQQRMEREHPIYRLLREARENSRPAPDARNAAQSGSIVTTTVAAQSR